MPRKYEGDKGDCLVTDELCHIKIPKCASTSMIHMMRQFPGFREDNFLTNPSVLDLRVVALLRDPVARFISAYNAPGFLFDPDRLNRHPHRKAKILRHLQGEDVHFEKQSWFLANVKLDVVGRVEEMDKFEQELGIGILPKLNVQNRSLPLKQLDEDLLINKDLLSTIQAHYAEDYDLIDRLLGATSS